MSLSEEIRRLTESYPNAYGDPEPLDEIVARVARDVDVRVRQVGLNATWSVSAWYLGRGRPNRGEGEYYLLDNEMGGVELVRRWFDRSPEVEIVAQARDNEKGVRKLLRKAKRLI